MKRSNLLTIAEVIILFVSVALALLLPASRFTALDLVWFVAGLCVLKLSDVWLPRGDAIGMSSALALGALLLFDARFVLSALAVAEILALLPRGREGKWRLALGALATEAAATVACSGLLVAVGLHPKSGVLAQAGRPLLLPEYLSVFVVGVLFAVLEHGLMQLGMAFRDRRPVVASLLGSLSYGGWLVAAQASAGVMAALMYRTMGAWGLLVSVVLILVMRQSFVLLLDIRQAYDATIGVLVRAMEAQSPGREGVAGRNAAVSVSVGRSLGMHGRDLERLRYAALLLGLGGDTDSAGEGSSAGSSHIVEGIEFLSDVTPILCLCDEPRGATQVRRSDLACSYVVMAVAEATGTVGPAQAESVRERVSPRIVREVDAAVESALADPANACIPSTVWDAS